MVPPGIEPGTQGFSVLCSTNWAMAPSCCFDYGCKGRYYFLIQQMFWKKKLKKSKISIFCRKKSLFSCRFKNNMYLCTRNRNDDTTKTKKRDVAQLASAPRSGRGGRKFESSHPDSSKRRCLKRMPSFFVMPLFYWIIPKSWGI